MRTLITLALVMLATVAGWWWLAGESGDHQPLLTPADAGGDESADEGRLRPSTAQDRELVAAPTQSDKTTTTTEPVASDADLNVTIHLLVVEEGSRTPLFGVELRDLGPQLNHYDTLERPGSRALIGATDAHGSVRAEVPFTEGRLIALEHRLYAPRVIELDGPVGTPDSPLVVELGRSASIFGRVLGALPGDTLFVRTVNGSRGLGVATGARATQGAWSAELDLSSGFEVNGLPEACELEATLRRERGGRRQFERFVLSAGERREVHWSLTGPGSISGVCIDESGGALSGIEINIHDSELLTVASEYDCPECYATTDLAGNFRFEGLPLGDYRIFSSKRDERQLVLTKTGAAQLTAQQTHVELTLIFAQQLSITGALRLPSGDSAGEMRVNLLPATGGARFGFTEADGRFEFTGLRPGEYWLQFGAPDSKDHVAPPPVRVEAGTQDLDVRMLEAGSLRFSLVDAASGEALEGRVFVDALQDESVMPLHFDRLRAEHLARRLRPGGYLVRADSDGGLCAVARDVRVHAGEETALELRLEPAAQLTFTYTGESTRVQLDALQAGVRIASQSFEPGGTATWSLPAGPVSFELRSYLEWAGMSDRGVSQWKVVASKELALIAGETLQLELRE